MDPENIHAVQSMLHLIFHRNKNQHGKSKWWKWLSTLKRTTQNIALALEDQNQPSSSKSGHSVEVYIRHLAVHVAPRCYLAFSTVVADTQFSALGTVLIATLSRLMKVTGITPDTKDWLLSEELSNEDSPLKAKTSSEDTGEPVSRTGTVRKPTHSARLESKMIAASSVPKRKESVSVKMEAPTKKKKAKKNAIDDLFEGLL